jgi:hypothetical protein
MFRSFLHSLSQDLAGGLNVPRPEFVAGKNSLFPLAERDVLFRVRATKAMIGHMPAVHARPSLDGVDAINESRLLQSHNAQVFFLHLVLRCV